VFYRVLDNSTVRILRIRHGAMDMDAVPMDDDE
jgi:plasmid stabilization system protein ParE